MLIPIGGQLASLTLQLASVVIGFAPLVILAFAVSHGLAALSIAFSLAVHVIEGFIATIFSAISLIATLASPIGQLTAALAAVVVISLIPLIAIFAALMFAVGGVIGSLMMFGGFLALAGKTDSFQEFKDGFGASIDRVVTALEPFYDNLMSLVGLFDAFMDVVIVFADAFASGQSIGSILFQAFKSLAIAISVILFSFAVFQNVLLGTIAAIAAAGIGLIDGTNMMTTALSNGLAAILQGILDAFGNFMTQGTKDMLGGAIDALSVESDIGADARETLVGVVDEMDTMSPNLGHLGQAIADLVNQTESQAAQRGRALGDIEDTNREISESLTNIPQGFKVAAARFRAIVPGLSSTGTGAETAAEGGSNFFIDQFTVISNDVEEFAQQVENNMSSSTQTQTGTPIRQSDIVFPGGA
jgi:hypothetical protein